MHDDARKDIDSLGGDVSDVEKDVGSLAKSRW